MSTVGAIGGVQPLAEDPQLNEAQGESAAAETVDLNDPRLTSEALDDNTAANAYDVPPPAPDGKWRAKLKHQDIKDPKGNMVQFFPWSHPNVENGRPSLVTNVEATILDNSGKFDGTRVTDQWVKTLIDKRHGTSKISTIATKAGAKMPAKTTDKQRMEILLQTLAGEPEVIIETAWEVSCQNCQETAKKKGEKSPRPFLQGMHRFPQTKPAVFDPIAQCPNCKGTSRAQVRIANYFSVTETKPTRGQ